MSKHPKVMVDAQVLIHAARFALRSKGKTTPEIKKREEFSAIALKKLDPIHIGSPAVIEVLRGVKVAEREVLKSIISDIHQLPLDAPASIKAVELLEKHNQNEPTCTRCLNALREATCPGCGKARAAQQRIVDAMLVGIAETSDRVDVFLSYDDGVLAYTPHVESCRIVKPEDWLDEGLPMASLWNA